ncbi:MAG: hypothetical protein RLZZ142_69 [Verrucomicrobiota bacterium]|jgi:hypothetical protein
MNERVLRGLVAAGLVFTGGVSFGQTAPAPRIDVSSFPKEAKLVERVVVPVPSEVFAVLDKLGKPNWAAVLRPLKGVAEPSGGREKISLMLGSVIAEGFIAVEAENMVEVKHIGESVRSLAKAIGVEKTINRRASSIVECADKRQWPDVRRELDLAMKEVREAMLELDNEPLAHLVSLGGWLRGTEALCQVVSRDFSRDGAELLHQPVLIEHFERLLGGLPERTAKKDLVGRVLKGLQQIRPRMGVSDGSKISQETVKEIGRVCGNLVESIHSPGKSK